MRRVIVVLSLLAVWSSAWPCGPKRLAKSRLFQVLKQTGWIDEGWGFPNSVEGVSSWNSDCRPSLTADGKYLYFLSGVQNGPPISENHMGTGFNMYVARWNGTAWDSVTHLGPEVNPASYSCISADGKTLYLTMGSNIYVSHKTATNWTKAQKLPEPVNHSDSHVKSRAPYITPDGKELYFASNRADGYGESDIWVARWNGTEWDSLTNCGERLNTSGTETHPALSPDGQKLYFSDFSGGRDDNMFGDADLYVSYRDAQGWGEGRLVGPPINTDLPCCSGFPAFDGNLYLGSEVSEGGLGEEDIWVVHPSGYEITREPVTMPGEGGWTNTGELEGAWYVYDLIQLQSGEIMAGTAPEGAVYITKNGGRQWIPTGELSGASKVLSLLQISNGDVFAGTYPEGIIYRTSDKGKTWSVAADLPNVTAVRSLLEMSDGTLVAGTSPDSLSIGRVYFSFDGGNQWVMRQTPSIFSGGIFALHEHQNVLFCSGRTSGDKVLVSINKGQTWAIGNLPWDDSHVSIGHVYWFYTASDGALWTGGWAHGPQGIVARSTDLGQTWSDAAEIHLSQYIMARIFDGVETENGMLAGGHPGPDSVLAITSDDGATWQLPGTLPGAREALCFLKASDGAIYAGTTPNGDVFKLGGSTKVALQEDAPVQFSLSQNYPNPFNAGTYLHYKLSGPANIHLNIYNIQGKLIQTLARGFRRGGDGILYWDGRDSAGNEAPSGNYFYRLIVRHKNGDVDQEIRKMTFLK